MIFARAQKLRCEKRVGRSCRATYMGQEAPAADPKQLPLDDTSSEASGSNDESSAESIAVVTATPTNTKDRIVVNDAEEVEGGEPTINMMEVFRSKRLLARITLPLKRFVERMDRSMAGCCMELLTHLNFEDGFPSLAKTAKNLTLGMAGYLGKEIASRFCSILSHANMRLYHDETIHLLSTNYWVRPVYLELRHASSRFSSNAAGELMRPVSGLVKVLTRHRQRSFFSGTGGKLEIDLYMRLHYLECVGEWKWPHFLSSRACPNKPKLYPKFSKAGHAAIRPVGKVSIRQRWRRPGRPCQDGNKHTFRMIGISSETDTNDNDQKHVFPGI